MTLLPTTQPGDDTASPTARTLLDAARSAEGEVPNYVRAFATRPAVYAAWRGLVGAVMGAMDHRTYEIATVGAARGLRSTYCSLAHGEVVLTSYVDRGELTSLLAAADARDVEGARTRDEAVAAFAAKVATAAGTVDAADIAALRSHGVDEQEALDIVLAAAARCFFSTVLDATATPPDAGFGLRLPADLVEELAVGRPPAPTRPS